MNLRTYEITERRSWDELILTLPHPHVLQSWDWGEFKSRWGWQVSRLAFDEGGQPVAAAQMLRRKLPRIPFAISYIPKGPMLCYDNDLLLPQVLQAIEDETRKQRSLFAKIDPDVQLGLGTQPAPPTPTAAAVLDTLSRRGWRPSAEQIQFKNTVSINLETTDDLLLAGMKSKTRYNIRLAERRGVSIRRGNLPELQQFYALYQETSQRDGFLIRPFAYCQDVWSHFLATGRAYLLLAEFEGEPIAGLILFVFGQTAWYMYGASSASHRSLMPNHLLQWEAMRLARQQGCSQYDMWGAPDQFDPGDPMWGVYRFKTGFGGHTIRGIGAYDYPPIPALYWTYTVLMPRILAFMRQRHGQPSAGSS